jgi:AsmA protein
MRRVLKIAGIIVGSLVALVVLAAVAILVLVDPNDHKDRITAAVQKSTGRELSLPGELKLSLFPWIAVETGEATLGNPAGFGDEPFLSLQRAKLSVKLLPLLKKQLQVGRIEIDGLDLRLKQNAEGKGNWEEWGSSDAEAQPAPEGGPAQLDLAGIEITGSRFAFEAMVAEAVNIRIGRVAPGVPIPVSLQMQLVSGEGAKPLPLDTQFKLTLDLAQQRYQLADMSLASRLQPQGAPQELDFRFSTPGADLNLAAQTLAPTSFEAQFGEARLIGQIEGARLIDAPALKGIFKLSDLSPRVLMQQFGIAPPVTRDEKVLAHFTAQGAWTFGESIARLTDLALTLDESKLTGRFAYDTRDQGMDFALDLDRIDLDRYQPPPTEEEEATEPIELPVDFIKPLRVKGTFDIGEIKIGGARLTQLSAAVAIADAVARFGPLKASMYGGSYSGDIGLDMRPDVPRLTMDEHMKSIDIAALMKDYADSERLSGKGNLDMVLSASGRSGGDLLKTLTGRMGVDLQNGAVEGIDVWYAIAQAQSLIQNRKLATVTNTKRTAFESFRASTDVVNGVATTKDLLIASQLLRVTGAGNANLDTQALDFTVTTTILKAPPGAEADVSGLERASIPVRITGTMTDPTIRPDLAGMAKERVKQEIEARKDEIKEEVQQRGAELEQKARDKVGGKLKDLLKR